MAYADIMAKSCHDEEDDDGEVKSFEEKEMEKQKLLYQQARLHDRGAAEMVLQTISASKGCQVSGPWESEDLDSLSELVQDIRLCSQALNKLDRQTLKQSWVRTQSHGHFLDRNSKCLLSATST
ncbi:tonsoku-like protein [Oreochromis niloticus]|uniref:tonsoku-like protein n=3 Tax=Oreochromis niloticus TaxID=8128 RepID=UPI000DF23682|nr:tonsoku-like protein [Oreochromis niloticus]CAI5646514.1 unnamed protein product [Mustela putorius furo]CAI5661153.1 unnamed protein product [Mustela putorius furo]CAI5661155.1 unnamed protein product [Mustela putorius furo]CAI5669408.1 unnamed protein product [Mustela putorius furo]